ncbi:MAG: hypothetical protein ACI84K_001901, partial [Pseudohongiellaceae bacterium]
MRNKIEVLLISCLFIFGFSLAHAADTLQVSQQLSQGQNLESSNGAYRFNFQSDGNLVIREQSSGSALWSSKTNGQNGTSLNMQSDGNLVLYTSSGSAVWSSGTSGTGATRFVIQGDGNAVLQTSSGLSVWEIANVDGSGGDNAGEGTITRQVWTGVSGTGLTALTGLSSYPNNPTTTDEIASFEAQS